MDAGRKRERGERSLLVGLVLPQDEPGYEKPLAELARLAETAGAVVVDRVVQKRRRVHPATFVGRGKAREIRELVEAFGIDLVIFDHDLSPAQGRNLEKILDVNVIDRSELILDIFATRARTRQARVQVGLAQLEYLRPRLRRMWTHLDRQQAAGSGRAVGIGTRGPGETQIEVDRRIVRRRIQVLKRELEEIERQRNTRAAGRRGFFTVSLVGYTNAGKSTLLRCLTGAETLIEDRLFATLDTKTRAWNLPGRKRVFLSDTVGFIRGLPHHLVASFHATLAETREADLLLHVVDASNPDASAQMATVEEVLREVGAAHIPRITVWNKVDLLPDRMALQLLEGPHRKGLPLSALTGEGVPDLEAAVLEVLDAAQVTVEVLAHPGDGRLLAFLAEKGSILRREYRGGEEVRIVARLPRRYAGGFRRLE